MVFSSTLPSYDLPSIGRGFSVLASLTGCPKPSVFFCSGMMIPFDVQTGQNKNRPQPFFPFFPSWRATFGKGVAFSTPNVEGFSLGKFIYDVFPRSSRGLPIPYRNWQQQNNNNTRYDVENTQPGVCVCILCFFSDRVVSLFSFAFFKSFPEGCDD